jgi:hypothetical protein
MEISKRMKLGLISQDNDDSSDEEWDDFDSSEEESEEEENPQYTFSKNKRRSSVNLDDMANTFNSMQWDSVHSSGYIGSSSRHLGVVSGPIEEDEEDEDTVDGNIS